MKDDNEPVRWSKEGKAKREEAIAKKDQEAKQKKALLLASELYGKWKQSLLKRKKTTASDLVTQLEHLHDQIEAAFATAGLQEWKPMVLKIIHEKTTRILAGQIADINEVTEIPPSFAKDITPSKARIRTKDEFLAIPFLKRISEKDGFVGFLRSYPSVVALFDDGEITPVARTTTEVGLTDFQTLENYAAEFAKQQRRN